LSTGMENWVIRAIYFTAMFFAAALLYLVLRRHTREGINLRMPLPIGTRSRRDRTPSMPALIRARGGMHACIMSSLTSFGAALAARSYESFALPLHRNMCISRCWIGCFLSMHACMYRKMLAEDGPSLANLVDICLITSA
jgi:hypothetical protein